MGGRMETIDGGKLFMAIVIALFILWQNSSL